MAARTEPGLPARFLIMKKKTGFRYSKKPGSVIILRVLVVLIVISVTLFIIYKGFSKSLELFNKKTESVNNTLTVNELWNKGDYRGVIKICSERLQKTPLDKNMLLYSGYSHFYLAVSKLSIEERNRELDLSIRDLRLLKVLPDPPQPEKISYILGKAYLFKGKYWADLSKKYLLDSLDSGYTASDTYEFLGKASSMLGEKTDAVNWYEKAAENFPTDRLLLTLGEELFNLGMYNESAEYYKKAIKITKDESLKKRGLSQLAHLYYDVGNYLMAEEVLKTLTGMEPENIDSLFLLGETLYMLGKEKEARKYWFAVTAINPGHTGALRRLYN